MRDRRKINDDSEACVGQSRTSRYDAEVRHVLLVAVGVVTGDTSHNVEITPHLLNNHYGTMANVSSLIQWTGWFTLLPKLYPTNQSLEDKDHESGEKKDKENLDP